MVLGEVVRVLVTESMVELGVVEGKVSCSTEQSQMQYINYVNAVHHPDRCRISGTLDTNSSRVAFKWPASALHQKIPITPDSKQTGHAVAGCQLSCLSRMCAINVTPVLLYTSCIHPLRMAHKAVHSSC
jgi:hypothetical protein